MAEDLPTAEELERLSAAATVGEWRHDGLAGIHAAGSCDTYSGIVWGTIIRAEALEDNDSEGRHWWASGEPDANAGFITGLVNTYRAGRLVHTDTPEYRGLVTLARMGAELDWEPYAQPSDDVAAAIAALDREGS